MKLNIDTSKLTFLAATEPEILVDPTTGSPKLDGNGHPTYSIQVVSLGIDGAEVMKVRTENKPAGIAPGVAIKIAGLVATPWSMGDRNGISFRADRVEPTAAR